MPGWLAYAATLAAADTSADGVLQTSEFESHYVTELANAPASSLADPDSNGIVTESEYTAFLAHEDGSFSITAGTGAKVEIGSRLKAMSVQLDENIVSALNTDGNLELRPNGAGKILVGNKLQIEEIIVDQNQIKTTTRGQNLLLSTADPTTTQVVFDASQLRVDSITLSDDTITADSDLALSATGHTVVANTARVGVLSVDNNVIRGNVALGDMDGNIALSRVSGNAATILSPSALIEQLLFSDNSITSTSTDGNILLQGDVSENRVIDITTVKVAGSMMLDNLQFDGPTISTHTANDDINIIVGGTYFILIFLIVLTVPF
jgi:hypothetical protein